MANYGIKQFNFKNVENYRQILESNRNQMDELFRKYQGELTNMESNWIGKSGMVSQSDMQELIKSYNGFLNKVNSFITLLGNAEVGFSDQEKESIATYNR